MAVKYYLEKRTDKHGDSPIRVSISIAGDRFVTSIGYNIPKDKWDTDAHQVKRGCSNSRGDTYTTINARISEIEAHFADIEVDLERKKIETVDIREEWALKFGRKKNGEEEKIDFFSRMEEFTKDAGKRNRWTPAVYEKFNALQNHIRSFKPKATFEDFNEEGLTDLIRYYENVQVAGKKYSDGRDTRVFGMKNSTIKRQLGFIKMFLKWAESKGYHTNKEYKYYKPKFKTTENKVVFLEWEELMTVYNKEFPEEKKYLDRARDVFCFCCFTSLRYSDVANLKRSNVFKNHIEVTTIKTHDSLTIELNDFSRAILKKYAKEEFPNNKALPVISNQRMNDYVKEVGELCEINEPVTKTYFKGNKRIEEVYPKYALMGTHTGRRTFISNAIMMGIPPQTVMKWTGHSDYKAMKPYIEIADKAKADAMGLFNKKMEEGPTRKDELTEADHDEMKITPETEQLHRCITVWCYSGIKSEKDPEFADTCKRYGVTQAEALKNKKYCQSLMKK